MTSAVTRTPAGLGLAQHLDRPGGGDVADVQAAADVLGQQHVAGDDRLLGDRRPAGQAEPGGHLALVHLRALGEPRLLGVLGDDPVERLHVFQGAAHQPRVGDAVAVVGEDPHVRRRGGHRAQLGELLAGQADGDRADRLHVDQARPRGPAARPARPRRRCRRPARCSPSRRPPCSRRAPPPASRSRPSRRPRGRARAGGCAGRPGRAGRPARSPSIDLGRRRPGHRRRRRRRG